MLASLQTDEKERKKGKDSIIPQGAHHVQAKYKMGSA